MFLVQPVVVLVVWWLWLISWVVVEAASNTERLYVTLGRWSLMDDNNDKDSGGDNGGGEEEGDAENGKNNGGNVGGNNNNNGHGGWKPSGSDFFPLSSWHFSFARRLQENQQLPQRQPLPDRYATTTTTSSSSVGASGEMQQHRRRQPSHPQPDRAQLSKAAAALVVGGEDDDDDGQSQSSMIHKMRRRRERGGRNPWNSLCNWGSNVARHLGGGGGGGNHGNGGGVRRGRISFSEMEALACPASTVEVSTIQATSSSTASSSSSTTTTNGNVITMSLQERLDGLKEPFVPNDVWDCLTGNEWQPSAATVDEDGRTAAEAALDDFVRMGEALARHDDAFPPPGEEREGGRRSRRVGPSWGFRWKPYKWPSSGYGEDEMRDMMEDGHVFVWTGRATGPDAGKARGNAVPVIKTRSLVPLSPPEMADLLMDSSRVKTYNSWSIGREDCWVSTRSAAAPRPRESQGGGIGADAGASMTTTTKIVKNRTRPPMGSRAMVSTTMLHARPVAHEPGTWLVVSRAVGGSAFDDAGDDPNAGRSDILLGMNLLQSHPPTGGTVLTAVTHVYSSLIPTMLAERLGVQSAINFVKDIRALRKMQKVGA